MEDDYHTFINDSKLESYDFDDKYKKYNNYKGGNKKLFHENNNNNTSNLYEKFKINSLNETVVNMQKVDEKKEISVQLEDLSIKQNKSLNIIKKDLTYGIKKTILSDFNYLYTSSNSNDFKVGVNKNTNQVNTIFDAFYIFPNISEINTKTETNIINEKKIELFRNKNDTFDKQYFPLDYIACGITIPLKTTNNLYYKKIIIKNVFWNIFQSIDNSLYKTNELLCIVPDKNEFKYKKTAFNIHFELHSQVSSSFLNQCTIDNILPYKNDKLKNINPANSCLFKVVTFTIDSLNGSNFDDIAIDIIPESGLECALLCVKVSIPDECIETLKGIDKYNKLFYGFVPFSQLVINFDYELSV
jgi:hypothetical protein